MQDGDPSEPPSKRSLEGIRSARWFIFLVVNMAAMTDSMFFGLIVPFVPQMLEERASLDEDQVQFWNSVLVGIYGAAVFVSSPIFGWLADRSESRKSALLLGYFSLAASTVLLHLGPSIGLLVLGRILQGFSSGAVSSVGFAILYDAFGNEEAGSAMGWAAAALDAGGFVGPAVAGILFQADGEIAVFIFAYAFIAFDICLGLAVVLPSAAKADSPVKGSRGAEYIASAESLIVKPSEENGHDQESKAPLVPTTSFWRLMAHPRLLIAFSGWLVIGIFETAFDSVLPLFVEKTYGWSVLGAGLIFIAFYLPGIITSPVCGYLMDRIYHASRVLGAGGFLVLTGPSFLLLGFTDGPAVGKQALLCVLLTLIGVGTGLSGPPLLKEVGVVVEEAEKAAPGAYGKKGATARAYGVHNAAFAVGNLLGPIVAGAIKAAISWTAMGWVFGILSLVAGAAVFCSLQGWIWKTERRSRLQRSVPAMV